MISGVFDGHLDLAYLVELGRDMHADPSECRGQLLPASVTLPSMREGRVRGVLGTIFTEAYDPSDPGIGETGAYAYPVGDAEAAHRAGMRQLMLYEAWARGGVITPMARRGRAQPEIGDAPVLGVLMECADPVRGPGELEMWAERGVVAIGLAWWRGSRYAGGNGSRPKDKEGLTGAGRELVARMDELGVVHDLTHLSQQASDDLLALTDTPVIASHSNCRAILGPELTRETQRHIDDETIGEVARRGGIIGVNLVANFLEPGIKPGTRPSIDWVVRHVEHVCEIVGGRQAVGLGTDMDGGFTAEGLPDGINRHADLAKLFDALRDNGWADDDLHAFAWGNWARFWGLSKD